MKIVTIYDHSGPKYHRCLLPLKLMPRIEWTDVPTLTDENVHGADIVFINRMPNDMSVGHLADLKEKHGFKLVVDNDDYWELNPDHSLYKFYADGRIASAIKMCMSIADAVFVTHERLRAKAIRYNSNVHVLPNAIPEFGQFLVKKSESENLRFFWCGSSTHGPDIALLKGPVKRIGSLGKIELIMGGAYLDNGVWSKMAHDFTNGGKLNHNLIYPLEVQEYYTMYAHCDVALVPIVANEFNSFKSNLKVLEAAHVGAPAIVTNEHPYKDLPVLYVDEPWQWYQHAKKLHADKYYREDCGHLLKEFCAETFNFGKINEERRQIFESLISK